MRAVLTLAQARYHVPGLVLRTLLAGLKAHALVLGFTAIYFLVMVATIWPRSDAITISFMDVVGGILEVSIVLTLSAIVLHRFVDLIVFAKPERPIAHFTSDLLASLFNPRRWATGLPMALAMLPFMYVYAIFKYNIPVFVPFSWDQTFELWGRSLHSGFHLWQWLEPFLSNVTATSVLSLNYILWGAFLWGTMVILGFSGRNDELRTRFFLTFMLTWSFGGSLLATIFSSAGPCFWQQLHLPGNPYAGVMKNLYQANAELPLGVVQVQNALWEGYSHHTSIAGISAMPSMHNATALLLALTALHFGGIVAILMWTHCILVFIGSVWLGWHYAVDGYVAFAITGFFWWWSKSIAAWWHSLSFVKDFDRVLAELPGSDEPAGGSAQLKCAP